MLVEKDVALVPPPAIATVVKEGLALDPPETRAIPLVEEGATEVNKFVAPPTMTLCCVTADALSVVPPLPDKTPVTVVTPVPPPPTDTVVKEGCEVAPLDTRATPDVEDGATELGALLDPAVKTEYCVIAVPVIALVPFPVRRPVRVAAPVPPPGTEALEKEGYPELPLETRGTPAVEPGEIEVSKLVAPPQITLYCTTEVALSVVPPFPESTPFTVLNPVPPPGTLATEKLGSNPTPLETRGTPAVEPGLTEVMALLAPATKVSC